MPLERLLPVGAIDVTVPADISASDFCRGIYPRLVGTIALDCGDVHVAEEIAQEALTRTYERWSNVAAMDHPEAWTFRVAFNLNASRWRRLTFERRARERATSSAITQTEFDTTDALAVRHAVATLPKRQRQAIVLRYFADLSVRETAEVMGCRDGTVKALTAQAIDALRARFGTISEPEDTDNRGYS